MTQFELKGLYYTEVDSVCFETENISQLQILRTRILELHNDRVFDTKAIKDTLKEILDRLPSNVVRVEYNSRIKESQLFELRKFNSDAYTEPVSLLFDPEKPGESSLSVFIYDMFEAHEL